MNSSTYLSRIKNYIITKIFCKYYRDKVIKLVIDRSGSMISMGNEAINGVIDFLDKEKKNSKGKYNVDIEITSFDDKNETLYEGNLNLVDKKIIEHIKNGMKPRGFTKIYDTCCSVLNNLKTKKEENRNKIKLFVLVTDGEDNSSIFYNLKDLKKIYLNLKKKKIVMLFL